MLFSSLHQNHYDHYCYCRLSSSISIFITTDVWAIITLVIVVIIIVIFTIIRTPTDMTEPSFRMLP